MPSYNTKRLTMHGSSKYCSMIKVNNVPACLWIPSPCSPHKPSYMCLSAVGICTGRARLLLAGTQSSIHVA